MWEFFLENAKRKLETPPNDTTDLHLPKNVHKSMSSRDILIKDLSNLLGFEDGAADVLDHLLTIESSTDLLDYLSQLLGSSDEKVQNLVGNIVSFQKGEEILATATSDSEAKLKAEEKPELDYGPKKTNKSKTPPRPKQQRQGGSKTPPRQKQTFSTKVSGKQTIASMKTPINAPTPAELKAKEEPKKEETKPTQKSRPTRGKAKVSCGCFGSFHKPLTNCLFCGRISCEKEGYDYCNFCGYLVERAASGSDAASKHKERLLRFDRDYAKRTVVLDDQADHFTQQSFNWMATEEEREKALELEQERSDRARKHPQMQLNLNL